MASPRPLRAETLADRPAPTRDRLLLAAERLIAENGVEAVSVRAVTQAAGVSVSAANYHFGSKDALVRETLWRVLKPMNELRLANLDELESAGVSDVEALLDAFLRPAFELRASGAPTVYRRFAAQLHSGSPEFEGRMKLELLNPSFQRYVDALARALPDRRRDDIALAFQFALGAALHVLRGHSERLSDAPPIAEAELLDRLVRFAADGIRASCPIVAGGEAP
jgi:AcrR family transcriptional regulator